MAWVYTGNPDDSEKDEVRFLIGDTLQDDPLLQDEEIQHFLTRYPNPVTAASYCCEAIAAKFSRQADKSIGGTSISASNRATAYSARAKELRMRRRALGLTVFAGGRSRADKAAFKDNTDAVQPNFELGQDDYDTSDSETSED